MQAAAAQQAEMKKIKALQDKLAAELTALSQKMNELQVSKAGSSAQGQVIHVALTSWLCLLLPPRPLVFKVKGCLSYASIDCII